MKKSEAYPSKYLRGADLSGPIRVTIRSVAHEPMFDGAFRPVVYCDGVSKPIVVNVTNANVLYALAPHRR